MFPHSPGMRRVMAPHSARYANGLWFRTRPGMWRVWFRTAGRAADQFRSDRKLQRLETLIYISFVVRSGILRRIDILSCYSHP